MSRFTDSSNRNGGLAGESLHQHCVKYNPPRVCICLGVRLEAYRREYLLNKYDRRI